MLENIKQEFEQVLGSDTDSSDLRELSLHIDTFYALSSAVDVGLFEGLLEPRRPDELAVSLGLHPGITGKLCGALASRGYLIEERGLYRISDKSGKFFVRSSPYYQGDLIRLMTRTRASRWSGLARALRDGPVRAQAGSQVFDEGFSLAMAEGAVCGSIQRTVRVLGDNPSFKSAKRCLDLGGCHGLYSMAFTGLNPDLHSTIFDLPNVIDSVTKKVVSGNERIGTLSGDFNVDDIGAGYDLVFASDVLYRDEETLLPLIRKIWESLNDGGLLVSKHYHIDDITNDSGAVLFDLMFSISGSGRVYSTSDFTRHLQSCGFSSILVEDISSPFNRSRIIMAKKVG